MSLNPFPTPRTFSKDTLTEIRLSSFPPPPSSVFNGPSTFVCVSRTPFSFEASNLLVVCTGAYQPYIVRVPFRTLLHSDLPTLILSGTLNRNRTPSLGEFPKSSAHCVSGEPKSFSCHRRRVSHLTPLVLTGAALPLCVRSLPPPDVVPYLLVLPLSAKSRPYLSRNTDTLPLLPFSPPSFCGPRSNPKSFDPHNLLFVLIILSTASSSTCTT